MRAIGNFLGSLMALAIVFALFNGLLWGIQEVVHYKDVKRCEGIEITLDIIKQEIQAYEKSAQYGRLSTREYEAYRMLIDKHNALTQEYNELAPSAYRRWWLLPFPIPSRH